MGFDRFEDMLHFLDRYIYCPYEPLSAGGLREEVEKRNPMIIRLRIGISLHTIVVAGYENDWIIVHDPATGPF